MSDDNDTLDDAVAGLGDALAPYMAQVDSLITKAKTLVDLLDDADRNHGGLVGGITMKAANELRLELSKWKA